MQRNLGENIDKLGKQIAEIEAAHKEKSQCMANIAASLDRLEKVLAEVQSQRDQERKLYDRFKNLSTRLETTASVAEDPVTFDIKLRRVLSIIKIIGQMIQIIASSTYSVYDSLHNVAQGKERPQGAAEDNADKPDLGAILKPMNQLVQAMTSSNFKAAPIEDTPVKQDDKEDLVQVGF
jgi:chromosome segregation ATPase